MSRLHHHPGQAAPQIAAALAETCERVGEPLNDAQKQVITGALAIWLDHYALAINREARHGL